MKISRTVVGVDTAKRVFQLYWVDMETGEIVDLRLTRTKFLEHFANRAPCLVALEACGGSQHWGRRLRELGHEVRLLPAKMVRPFVGGNKNDAHDARAIWTAVQQPGIETVAIKTEEQQAILALHRMRQQLVKFRTAQINCLRGLLTEYGEVMPKGRAGMRRGMAEALARVSERLPAKGASFGRFGGWRRRYPGGSECRSIFLTVSRAMPNRLAASRWLRPSTWQASRTRRYRSTVYILPPSISKKDRRLQVAEFYSARGWEIPPLPWTNLSPPFSSDGSF